MPKRPLTQSLPRLAGPWRPSTLTMSSPRRCTSVWQPTPQNGHRLGSTRSATTSRRVAASSISVRSISAPVGQAWTHSPQATQEESPIGSPMSNTGTVSAPRCAMPMTSLTCTSRQARSHSPQAMQASRLTAIEGCEASWNTLSTGTAPPEPGREPGKRGAPRPVASACAQNGALGSGEASRAGMSEASSSITRRRLDSARSEAVRTTMPSAGLRMQEAASTRSPSTSTMQARQLPSAR